MIVDSDPVGTWPQGAAAGPDDTAKEGHEHGPKGVRIGEPFNPWRKGCGFYPPDIVARQRNLTDGQKRLYERAVRWAGKQGKFWHGFETMADALGKSVRQVKDDMAVLESIGLIRHARRRRSSNVYSFLWHAMFEVRPTALQEGILEVQDSTPKVQDSVIPKVQPTARESSPLELCPLNLVKADHKLITDDASQKQRSAASLRVSAAEGSPSSRKSASTPDMLEYADWSPEELAEVRRRIVAFWGREPEEGFEVSVMLRARGATAADVCDLLDRKYANTNCRVGGRWAPKNQNWFLTVIENEFNPGHLPEPPASTRTEDPFAPEAPNAGIDALELPDAPRSIVESVMCGKCRRAALVRYADGVIDGCRCQRHSF